MFPKDDDSAEDDYDRLPIVGIRKNFRSVPRSLTKHRLNPKDGISKDGKAAIMNNGLAKALPTILSDATSAISLRLGEHRLQNLREDINTQRLKCMLKNWRYEFELRAFWSQKLAVQLREDSRHRKKLVFQGWQNFGYSRLLSRRRQKSITSNVDFSVKQRILCAWRDEKRRSDRLHEMTQRIYYTTVRYYHVSWNDAVVITKIMNRMVQRQLVSRNMKFSRLCLHGMLAVVHANTAFYKTSALVKKYRLNDICRTFRLWREGSGRLILLKVAGKRCYARLSKMKKRLAFSIWFDWKLRSKCLRTSEMSLSRNIALKKKHQALESLSNMMIQIAAIDKCGEMIARRQNRLLLAKVLAGQRALLESRCRVSHSAHLVASKRKANIASLSFSTWYSLFARGRQKIRAMRMRSNNLFSHSHLLLVEWAARTRRCIRFRIFTNHILRGVTKPSTCLKVCFEKWKRRAADYWIGWRKIERFQKKSANQLKAVLFLVWLRDKKVKYTYLAFLKKFQLKKMSDFFYAWAQIVHTVILRSQKVQQGIHRMNVIREWVCATSALDFWHLKAHKRRKVQEMAARKDEQQDSKVKNMLRSIFTAWIQHIRKLRKHVARTRKLQRSSAYNSIFLLFHSWKHHTTYLRILNRKSKALTSNYRSSTLKSVFQILIFHFQCMRSRRLMFERNAARLDNQASVTHFGRWTTLHERTKFRNSRVHHFIKSKADKYLTRRLFDHWMAKHHCTLCYDQTIVNKNLCLCRNVLTFWYQLKEVVQYQQKKATSRHISYRSKQMKSIFEAWCFQHVTNTSKSMTVHGKTNRKIVAVRFQEWRLHIEDGNRMQNMRTKIQIRSTVKMVRDQRNCFESWLLFRAGTKHRNTVFLQISNRSSTRTLRRCLHQWGQEWNCEKILKFRLQKAQNARLFTLKYSFFSAWGVSCQAMILLDKKIGSLDSKISHRSLSFGFAAMAEWNRLMRSLEYEADCQREKAHDILQNKIFHLWLQEHHVFERRAFKIVSNGLRKVLLDCKSVVLHSWKIARRKERRLALQIENWERKDARRAFSCWSDSVIESRFGKAKVVQHTAVREYRTKIASFCWWHDYCVQLKRRRWGLQFFCDKAVSRFLCKALHALHTFAVQQRRHKVLVKNLQQTTNRINFFRSARYLLDFTRDSIRCKNLLEKGYSRYLGRMVRSSWDIWESKIIAKKRTTEVLAKAGAVLIGMM